MGIKKGVKLRAWTKQELATLKRSIAKHTNKEIAVILGRTYSSVNLQLHKRGIVRSKTARRRHANGLFTKGSKPWNKGLKGLHHSPATEFKKGHKPANTKFDGCISIRLHRPTGCQYKYIRVAEGKWKLLHHWKWEQKYGPIPPKHILSFRNGDTLNTSFRNLRLMSMANNAHRNRNLQKMRDGIRRAWQRGAFINSDKWVAFTLGIRDKALREQAMRSPELLELQRMKIKLKRAIRGKA